MESEVSVGAVLFNEKGKALLLRGADKEAEFWEFPKGHKKSQESDLETLSRELL